MTFIGSFYCHKEFTFTDKRWVLGPFLSSTIMIVLIILALTRISKIEEVLGLLKDVLTNHPFLDFNGCSDKETSIYDEPALLDLISHPDYASIIKTLLSSVILIQVLRQIVWCYFMKSINSPDKKQVVHNESPNPEDETLEPKQDVENHREIPLKKK